MLIKASNLEVSFIKDSSNIPAVSGIDLVVNEGECVGLVGESGSGKSVTAKALLGLFHGSHVSINGGLEFSDKNLVDFSEEEFSKIRGKDIGMVFQEPMTALNPVMTIYDQISEPFIIHSKNLSNVEIENLVFELLQKVGLPFQNESKGIYPHQLSGGMRQRVVIAMSIALRPKLLLADEPTTALDVTVQAQILNLLRELKNTMGMSILLISHDLGVVAEMTDRLYVMRTGKIVEEGPTAKVLKERKHVYTQTLYKAMPTLQDPAPKNIARTTEEVPLLWVKDIKKSYKRGSSLWGTSKQVVAVSDVSLNIYTGETLGIVGESGSGKSTLGRLILKLEDPDSGSIFFEGKDISHFSNSQMVPYRKEIQIVFQDPFSSLNPRKTIRSILEEPLLLLGNKENSRSREQQVLEMLCKVGLPEESLERYPHEFSGGQRQRIGIARAVLVKPKLLVLDEPVSALDVSIQAQILKLLKDLQNSLGLTCLFISHDLRVVRQMCHRIAVMKNGKIVEEGESDSIFKSPQADYTKKLLNSVPKLDVFS